MDISKITLNGIRINKIEFDADDLYELSNVQVVVRLTLAVNTEDYALLRLDGKFELVDSVAEKTFMILAYSAIFETENDSLETDFSDLPRENINEMLESIIGELSPVIELVTEKTFVDPIKIENLILPDEMKKDREGDS